MARPLEDCSLEEEQLQCGFLLAFGDLLKTSRREGPALRRVFAEVLAMLFV